MKKWYQSWTIWFNLIVIILTAVNEAAKVLPVSPELVALVAGLLNIVLRVKTSLPIK